MGKQSGSMAAIRPEIVFAVVPDQIGRVVASFAELEDAIEWGLHKYGSDGFAIRDFNHECPAAPSAAPFFD
jgi:hypothetical protein